jgi:serine/threonine-protein kinase
LGISWILTDGSGEAEQLTSGEGMQIPTSWSRDDVLAYLEGLPNNGDIWVLPLEGERKPRKFLATEFNERYAMFSPGGQWIAFTSDRSGQDEIYVTPYPGPGGTVPISTEGGSEPMWSRSGKELFYRNGDKMMVVSVQTEPTFRAETPRLLFEGAYLYGRPSWAPNYDVSLDGERLLMIKEEPGTNQINVVLNWFEELKRLVPIP